MRSILLFAVLSLGIAQSTLAEPVGPAKIAKVDSTLWSEKINTSMLFNKASRASELIYLRNLHSMKSMTDSEMLSVFKINSVNRNSVDKWVNLEINLTLSNYFVASKKCEISDWTCKDLANNAENFLSNFDDWVAKIPPAFSVWQQNLDVFSHTYIAEQMRLAALFPKVTSEIDTFNDNEWTGTKLADGEFYLTFDDGPTKIQGLTDDTLNMLKEQKKSGTFFILGNSFQARVSASSPEAMKSLYADQCVALHGWEHQSHAKWEGWQDSIVRTQAIIIKTIEKKNTLSLFRPPYGQRKEDSADFFKAQNLRVALWNIDSQDWNAHVDADEVESRIVTLMLIKRHGVILFHDIHSKSKAALPKVFADTGNAVIWGDCHTLSKL